MKYNGHKDKCQLRRQQLVNKTNRAYPTRKKSLNRRIIAERVGGITADNIDREYEKLGCMIKVDELTTTIMYHIKFGRDTRPSLFNDDVVVDVLDRIKDLQVKFLAGMITAKEQVEILEDIDAQIVSRLDNYKQCK